LVQAADPIGVTVGVIGPFMIKLSTSIRVTMEKMVDLISDSAPPMTTKEETKDEAETEGTW
jgi:hypothetical protein